MQFKTKFIVHLVREQLLTMHVFISRMRGLVTEGDAILLSYVVDLWLICVNCLQLLSPRTDIGMYQSGRNKKKKTREGEDTSVEMKMEEIKDPATIVCYTPHHVDAEKAEGQKGVESRWHEWVCRW